MTPVKCSVVAREDTCHSGVYITCKGVVLPLSNPAHLGQESPLDFGIAIGPTSTDAPNAHFSVILPTVFVMAVVHLTVLAAVLQGHQGPYF